MALLPLWGRHSYLHFTDEELRARVPKSRSEHQPGSVPLWSMCCLHIPWVPILSPSGGWHFLIRWHQGGRQGLPMCLELAESRAYTQVPGSCDPKPEQVAVISLASWTGRASLRDNLRWLLPWQTHDRIKEVGVNIADLLPSSRITNTWLN